MATTPVPRQTALRRPLCAEVSSDNEEPLYATASRIDHWLLIEYRGVWSRHPLAGNKLRDDVKAHLERQLALLPRSRLLFIRRPERRRHASLACYFGSTPERGQRFFRLEVESHEDLLHLDLAGALVRGSGLGSPLEHPLLLVCTHGKRDRCCARYGRPLYDELREQTDPDWVWQSTHVGGDRFAGNLVCLPEGLYFGRVRRADVWSLVDDYLAGRVYLDLFRGRSCYSCPVQSAERAVRLETGLTGVDDLALLAVAQTGAGWSVRFRAKPTDEVHELELSEELGDLTYLTCGAEMLTRPRRFPVTAHRARREP